MAANQAKSGLVSRSVASCFLFNNVKVSKPKVALFRRSAKVSTYQHCLGPIAGSIETSDKSPIAAVWREIKEETTLTSANLKLLRQGKPYSFTDESVGRVWTVHPFAFSLRSAEDESRIQIDWEHEGWSWHDPHDVTDDKSFGGVPFLAKSLRRVWFEMDLGEVRGQILRDGIAALQEDHESGARQLAGKALDVFRQLVAHGQGENVETWSNNARFAAWHLWKNGRESMGAAIINVLVRSLALVEDEVGKIKESETGVVTAQSLSRLSERLDDFVNERKQSAGRIWDSFESVLHRTSPRDAGAIKILTLSSSSTILQCLKRAAIQTNFDLDLRVLESRPLFEGVSMAAQLVQHLQTSSQKGSVKVTMFSDASAALASQDIDMVLLGADLVRSDGAVSNKTGSLPAILSAKHISPGARVVVLAENEKILPVPAPSYDEEGDSSELRSTWELESNLRAKASTLASAAAEKSDLRTVEVSNIPFEWVAPELIDEYINENGQAGVAEVAEQTERLKQEADRFFAEA